MLNFKYFTYKLSRALRGLYASYNNNNILLLLFFYVTHILWFLTFTSAVFGCTTCKKREMKGKKIKFSYNPPNGVYGTIHTLTSILVNYRKPYSLIFFLFILSLTTLFSLYLICLNPIFLSAAPPTSFSLHQDQYIISIHPLPFSSQNSKPHQIYKHNQHKINLSLFLITQHHNSSRFLDL